MWPHKPLHQFNHHFTQKHWWWKDAPVIMLQSSEEAQLIKLPFYSALKEKYNSVWRHGHYWVFSAVAHAIKHNLALAQHLFAKVAY